MEYLQAPTNNIYYQAGNDNRKVTLADGVECYNRREEEWSPLGRESDERRHSRRNFKHMLVAKAIQMRQPAKTSRNRRTNLFSRNMYSFVFLFFLFPRKPLILTWKMSEKVFLLCPIKEEGRQLIYKTFQKKKKRGNYQYFFNNLHFLYVFFFSIVPLSKHNAKMPKISGHSSLEAKQNGIPNEIDSYNIWLELSACNF